VTPEIVKRFSAIQDKIVSFQERFPFHQVNIENYLQLVFSINQEKFSIEDLSNNLTDDMWDNFDVYKLLMNLPDHEEGLIDIYSMIVIGLLWCEGDVRQKILGLY
jgi:hypothetical protein